MKNALLLILLALCPTLAIAASGGPDSFGYEWFDSDHSKGADFEWIDISQTGTQVLDPSGGSKANIDLNPALIFYGRRHDTISVSTNGYISTDPSDNGGDNSNDCPFPSDVSSGGGDRIAVLHDDLDLSDVAGTEGGIYHQYFPSSPHPWHPAGVHIIQWENARHEGSTAVFNFQILIFDNFDIVMQYGSGNTEDGSGSTTGIQNVAMSENLGVAEMGLKVACDFAGGIPDNYAITILPPRVTVTTSVDVGVLDPDGTGTLRNNIVAASPGTRIEFDPSLSGETIYLSASGGGIGNNLEFHSNISSPTQASSRKDIAVDASALADGIIIRGPTSAEADSIAGFVGGFDGYDVRLMKLHFEPHASDPTATALLSGEGDGLYLHDCVIESGSVDAVEVTSANLIMSECEVTGGQIHLKAGDGTTSCLFHETTVSGSGKIGLEVESGYQTLVEDCSISFNSAGGIKVKGNSGLVVRDSNVVGNMGVGIHCDLNSGKLAEIVGSTISLNINTENNSGGGVYNDGDGNLILRGSTLNHNLISEPDGGDDIGAGLCTDSPGTTTVEECTFSGNIAERGSAIYAFGQEETVSVQRSTFDGNSASEFGTLYFRDSDVDINLCTITENSGNDTLTFRGTTTAEITQTTLHDNGNHQAIWVREGAAVSILESVISGGTSDLIDSNDGTITSLGDNLTNHLTPELTAPSDIHSTDPMLGSLGNYGGPTKTFLVLPGSPLIDAGRTITLSNVKDQRGYLRPTDGNLDGLFVSDIGAVEFQGAITVTTEIDETADPGVGVSLREALAAVDPGGFIDFAPGLGGSTIALSAPLVISDDVTIDASALANPVAISGQNTHRVLEVNSATASLTNLTLIDGDGGGVSVTGVSSLSLANCTVRRCKNGGSGGGIYVASTAILDVRDSTISGNDTTGAGGSKGGGIFGEAGSAIKLLRTQISGNTTTTLGKGGGLALEGRSSNPGALEITRCSIINNTSGDDGGGLFFDGAIGVTITNSTISGNVSSGGRGGGAFATGGSGVSFRHSTIADNRSDTKGGGLHAVGIASFSLGHTILAANRNATGLRNGPLNQITSVGYNLCDDNSLQVGLLNTGDITERAAHLAPLANYGGGVLTHALHAISPAIDGGNAVVRFPPTIDQRGFARIANGEPGGGTRIDIGAVEAAKPTIVDTIADETNIITNTTSLREALRDANDGGRILFDLALSGEGIHLGASQFGQGELIVDRTVQIDATLLPGGISINGDDETRCFRITGNRPVAMHAIEIKNGRSNVTGGGILSDGELVLTYCTLRGNRASNGGGAIACAAGSVLAWNSSIVSNEANNIGSGVRLLAGARGKFHHCTIADNGNGNGQAAIGIDDSGLVLYSTIIADNGANFFNAGAASIVDLMKSNGYNLTDDSSGGVIAAFDGPGDQTNTAPQFGTLNGDSGGWGPIITILSGSPARNAGDPMVSLLSSFEVRGYLRVQGVAIDIGAVEFESKTEDSDSDEMPDWWELLHGLDPDDASDADEDPDLDFSDNLEEFQNGTDPFKAGLVTDLKILHVQAGLLPFTLDITFASDPGAFYEIENSPDLTTPFMITLGVNGVPGTLETTVTVQGGDGRGYFRVRRP